MTALDTTEEVLERVLDAAAVVGLTGRVRGLVTDLASWAPDIPLNAVVCAAAAFKGLSSSERDHAIALLQAATTVGGLHVVETGVGNTRALPLEELKARYDGWNITVEHGTQSNETFLAWKDVA